MNLTRSTVWRWVGATRTLFLFLPLLLSVPEKLLLLGSHFLPALILSSDWFSCCVCLRATFVSLMALRKGFVSCLSRCLWSVQRCTHSDLCPRCWGRAAPLGPFSAFIPSLMEWVQRSVAASSGPILMKETECLGRQNRPFAKRPRESLSSGEHASSCLP